MAPTPLTGIRVVSLAVNLPGPLAAARLRARGASVVKVEPPWGDPLERYESRWYASLHRDTPVERLDLKTTEGRARLHELLEEAELFLTSSRPGARRRMGTDFPSLHARHQRLCSVAIVGDRDDPEAPGHDLTYQAAAGLVDPPNLPRALVADTLAGERAASAGLELLLARERSGTAAEVEVSIQEADTDCAAPLRHGLTAEGGLLGGGSEWYGVYRARDGWVALAALEEHFRERLRKAARKLAGAGTDPSERDGGDSPDLARLFRQHPPEWWEAWARERDIPLVAVARGR